MSATANVPGTGWYVCAGIVAGASLAAVAALVAWFVLALDGGTQFLAPGRQVVELDRPGKYVVWNDYRTLFQGRTYDESERLPENVSITVLDPASGTALVVAPSGGMRSDMLDAVKVSVATFEIARPGRYEIIIEGGFPQRVFSVSRDFLFNMLGMIFGVIAVVVVGFSLAFAIATWAFIKREEAREAAAQAQGGAARMTGAPALPGERSLGNLTAIVYGLQVASFFVGFPLIAGVIVNYVKRREVEGTWLESHFRWQIRTFWYSLPWLGAGLVTLFILVGILILFVTAVWVLYRAIRGWIALEDGKAIYL